jgi:hypothetical protein
VEDEVRLAGERDRRLTVERILAATCSGADLPRLSLSFPEKCKGLQDCAKVTGGNATVGTQKKGGPLQRWGGRRERAKSRSQRTCRRIFCGHLWAISFIKGFLYIRTSPWPGIVCNPFEIVRYEQRTLITTSTYKYSQCTMTPSSGIHFGLPGRNIPCFLPSLPSI